MTDDPHAEPDDLDAVVRRADPDRWLASRFIADRRARADVVGLYAFNDELARIAPAVSNPLIGEIRLAWWREALDEIAQGRPVRRHPVAEALAGAVARRGLDLGRLHAMVAARAADLDGAPFADDAALYDYLEATAGGLMALAAAALGAPDAATQAAARAWGVAGLARGHWAGAANRLPADWTGDRVGRVVIEGLDAFRRDAGFLPTPAFPAVAYAALALPYARRRMLSDVDKRWRLVWAVLRGRV